MNRPRKVTRARVAIAASAVLFAGYFPAAQAAGTDGTYYQVEGEPNCNSFSPNNVGSFTVQNPSDSGTASNGMLNLAYTVDRSGPLAVVAWNTQPPSEAVSAVILVGGKISGKQKSVVYHFGVNGAAMDSGEVGPSTGLAKITFCYGLGPLVGTPPPEPQILPVCKDIESGEELLDFTGVQCPTPAPDPDDTSDRRFIFSVNPYGQNGEIAVCTCNFDEALQSCNAELEAGAEGSCLPFPDQMEGEPAKGLTWVPAEIVIFQNGTGACYTTLSGGRICFR